jgi:hypothetical protein
VQACRQDAPLGQSATIDRIDMSHYKIPTDTHESDGTREWDHTKICVVIVNGGGQTGLPLAWLECQYTYCEPHRNMVPIVTTAPHFGGERLWFRCDCKRRAGRPFLPDGKREFLCRHCWKLTYQSAQRHDATVYAMARDEEAIERAVSSGVHRTALRGVAAFRVQSTWARKGRLGKL